jgi:curved DNA-binding protein CbpA
MYKRSFQWYYDRWVEKRKAKASRPSGYGWHPDKDENELVNDRLRREYAKLTTEQLIWKYENTGLSDRERKIVLRELSARDVDIEELIAATNQKYNNNTKRTSERHSKPRSFRTHYDNLQVARNASQEVIRAAYRSLSQKYHPDKNPDAPEAERIMRIINAAYETLSDPERKRHHDEWIDEMLKKIERNGGRESPPPHPPEPPHSEPPPKWGPSSQSTLSHFRRWWFGYTWLACIIFALLSRSDKPSSTSQSSPSRSNSYSSSASPSPQRPRYVRPATAPNGNFDIEAWLAESVKTRYVRPATAPNGNRWPQTSGYIKGYPSKLTDGLSTVTIDNSANDTDVFAKIFRLGGVRPIPIRYLFIKAGDKFTAKSIRAGYYDVRYLVLDTGHISRSESFELQEIDLPDATHYSTISMTLYKVSNGNMQTYPIPEEEFKDSISVTGDQ